ncbi:hypothetical protein ACWCXK_06060 [Streptomyces sp. NPDC001739]
MSADLPLEDMPDDLMGVVEEHIEQRLGRPVSALRDEVATAKTPHAATARVVREYTELALADEAVVAREDELFDLIVASAGVFGDEHLAAAQAVNNAVTYRDARVATVVHAVLAYSLNRQAPGHTSPAAVKARPHQTTAAPSTLASPPTPAAAAPTAPSARRR